MNNINVKPGLEGYALPRKCPTYVSSTEIRLAFFLNKISWFLTGNIALEISNLKSEFQNFSSLDNLNVSREYHGIIGVALMLISCVVVCKGLLLHLITE